MLIYIPVLYSVKCAVYNAQIHTGPVWHLTLSAMTKVTEKPQDLWNITHNSLNTVHYSVHSVDLIGNFDLFGQS